MNRQLIFLFLLLMIHPKVHASELIPFETDYCTWYPEGPKDRPELWKHCCLQHDLYFWAGGTREDRNKADVELKSCIHAAGARTQSLLMYLAVRAGSYSPIKNKKKKWGNGWPRRAAFKKLSLEDVLLIEEEIHSAYDFIPPAQKDYFVDSLRSRLE